MINVLWFDDEKFQAIIDDATDLGITIDHAPTLAHGLRKLKENKVEYDLLLFDANYCIDANSPSKMILSDTIKRCEMICKKQIPWLVYTAGAGFDGADSLKYVIPKEDWMIDLGLAPWYSKHSDESLKALMRDIPRVVDYFNSPHRRVKKRHREVFELFDGTYGLMPKDYEKDLLDILESLEATEKHEELTLLNRIRQFAAGPLKLGLQELGVVPQELSTLNEVEKHFCNPDWRKQGLFLWVQSAMSHVVQVCQDASHDALEYQGGNRLEVSKSYKGGYAKYLLPSVIYDLLNVLMWIARYSEQFPDKEANQLKFPLSRKKQKLFAKIKEYENLVCEVMQDENGDFYSGECLLPKEAGQFLAKEVRLCHVRQNKTGARKAYCFLADYERIDKKD